MSRPLFSTGVHLAATGASLAAAYVATALRDPDLTAAARDAYQRLYLAQYGHFHDMAQLFYGTNRARESYFWEARRLTGETRLELRAAFVRAISGQAAFQVERAALAHAALPEDLERELERQVAVHGAPRVEPTDAMRGAACRGPRGARAGGLSETAASRWVTSSRATDATTCPSARWWPTSRNRPPAAASARSRTGSRVRTRARPGRPYCPPPLLIAEEVLEVSA